jgi:Ca2+-transporting ATPase
MSDEVEMRNQVTEPLLDENSRFKYTARALADIVILDNHYKEEKTEFPERVISSRMIVEDFHGAANICASLCTNPRSGLSDTAAETSERKRIYGVNAFAPPQIKTIGELVMENFDDPINVILLIAGLVSMAINLLQEGWPKGIIEGLSIIISLMIIIGVNSGNNYSSERRLADLVNLAESQMVAVFRGDEKESKTIDATELLVGDVILFSAGMKVPADCIVLEGQDICCDEGELTGEPMGIDKIAITSENYNEGGMATMLAKSLIQSGTGRALVLAVGPNSVAGVITEKTQTKTEATLLQQKLATIADKIGLVGFACATLTFVAMLIRIMLEMVDVIPCGCENITACNIPDPKCTALSFAFTKENRLWKMVLDTFIICIAIIVAAIPEGLPLAVTISLSFSSAQMMKLNNLVRKLASSEAMGGATHICSDKTGTLTQNKMTVMAIQAVQKVYIATVGDPDKYSKELATTVSNEMGSTYQDMFQGIMWNSSARIEKDKTGNWVTMGNVTEQGIIKFFMNNEGAEGCNGMRNSLTDENTLALISFSSSRKRASIVIRNAEKEGTNQEVRIYTKGAPDMLFPMVSGVVNANGEVCGAGDTVECPQELIEIGNESETTYLGILEKTVKLFAGMAFRTILVTYRDMSMDEFNSIKSENNDFEKEADREILEHELVAVGIFGLQDPLRPGIIESIQ